MQLLIDLEEIIMPRCFALMAGLSGFCHIFNIDQPVGRGCPNMRADVLLVQWMLAVWLSKAPKIPESIARHMQSKNIINKSGALKIDGVYGSQTMAWIKGFEESYTGVVKDGRIDPLGGGMGTTSGKTMKLWLLNNAVWAAGGFRGGILGVNSGSIHFPTELVPHLFR